MVSQTMSLIDYQSIASKRRRVLDVCEFGRNSSGFIDSCRFCSKQILRKGQSRPRICLECEKKKATPIHDLCKDCRDPIIRSNVRKARICPKCKKKRERSKNESSYAVGAYPNRLTLNPTSARIYAVNNWLSQLAQCHQHIEPGGGIVSMNAILAAATAPIVWPEGVLPAHSGIPKIHTEQFNTPEDIVQYLLQRQNISDSSEIEEVTNGIDSQAPILIPLVNPFEMRRHVPVEQLKHENEALAVEMRRRTSITPPMKNEQPVVKREVDDDGREIGYPPSSTLNVVEGRSGISGGEHSSSLLEKFQAIQSEFNSVLTAGQEEQQPIDDPSRLEVVVRSLRDLLPPDDNNSSADPNPDECSECPAVESFVVAALSSIPCESLVHAAPYLFSLHVPSAVDSRSNIEDTKTTQRGNDTEGSGNLNSTIKGSSSSTVEAQLESGCAMIRDRIINDVSTCTRCSIYTSNV